MEKFERFSEERLTSLRARYRGDDLFRTWTWILCLLEQQLNGLNAVEVWSETEMIRQKLSAIKEHRDNEVEFLYGELKNRHQSEKPLSSFLLYSSLKCVMQNPVMRMMLLCKIRIEQCVRSWLIF